MNSNVTIPSRVTVSGTANLILSDGFKLTVNDGIGVGNNNTLTIYGQSGGTGTLETANITDDEHAGIGGSSSMSAGGTITINGGIITARGGKFSAGIGGSWSGSGGTITINGGTVTAYGGAVGAGIGGGQDGSAGTISISGGSVTAIGSSISLNGLGELGKGGTISLGWKNEQDFIYANYYGGTITFQKEFLLDDGNGTVATANNIIYGAKIVPSSSVHTVTVGTDGISASRTHVFVGDTVTLSSNLGYPVVYYVDGTAIELNTFTMPNKDVTVTAVKVEGYVSYVDYDGSTKYVDGYATLGSETDTLSGWVYVAETLNLDKRLTVEGEAHLILRDGVTLTVNGINVTEGNSLTIYAQEGGTGTLTANASTGGYNAAIGGTHDSQNCGNVTINGGTVNATGRLNCAGIGGAYYSATSGSGGNITINRGTVNATGGGSTGGAGIGGGANGNGGTLTVNGGTVTATGGGSAAGIGGGGYRNGYGTGGTVIINGGNVTANGGSEASGIGGGRNAYSGGTTKLGWTNTSDSIYASSYSGTVTFISGFLLDGTDTVATADNINGDVKKIVPNTATFNITTADGITSDLAYTSAGSTVTLTGGKQNGYCYVLVYGGTRTPIDGSTFTMPSAHVYVDTEPITYSITYELGGGMATDNPTTYTVETETFTLNNPMRDGYNFAGWTGTGLGSATETVTIAKGSTGARSYTATWTIQTYTITYDLDGGTAAGNPETFTVESDAITLNNPTKAGYDFAGWTGTGLDEATDTVTIAKGSAVNRTYTATWTINQYTITYNLDGGSVSTANPTSYTVETEGFTLNNPTKNGHVFTGWNGTGIEDGKMSVIISKGSTGNRTYTATFRQKGFNPADDAKPEFAYHAPVLSGQIGIKFYAYIPEQYRNSSTCYVDFDVNGDKSANPNPCPFDASETITIDGDTFYTFECFINSVQMADAINAVMHYGDGQTLNHTYRAKDYLDTAKNNTELDNDLRELVCAMKDYGGYVQRPLADYNGWTIGTDHASMDCESACDDFTGTASAVAEHAIVRDIPAGSNIEKVEYALILDTETRIIVYLTTKESYTGGVSARIDDSTDNFMAVKKGARLYTVETNGIPSHKLGKVHTITIATDEGTSFAVKVSAFSYVHDVLKGNDEALKKAVVAIYNYCVKTRTYMKNRPTEFPQVTSEDW